MRLVLFSALVILGFALLIFGAQMIGEAQPLPDGITDLHLTDCALPCWNGITLGETQLGYAFRSISEKYGKASQTFFGDGATISAHYETSTNTIFLEVYVDTGGVAQQVELFFPASQAILLGDMVSLFGKPTKVFGVPPNTVVYRCESTWVYLVSDGNRGWSDPIEILTISYTPYPAARCAIEMK